MPSVHTSEGGGAMHTMRTRSRELAGGIQLRLTGARCPIFHARLPPHRSEHQLHTVPGASTPTPSPTLRRGGGGGGGAALGVVAQVLQHARQAGPAEQEASCRGTAQQPIKRRRAVGRQAVEWPTGERWSARTLHELSQHRHYQERQFSIPAARWQHQALAARHRRRSGELLGAMGVCGSGCRLPVTRKIQSPTSRVPRGTGAAVRNTVHLSVLLRCLFAPCNVVVRHSTVSGAGGPRRCGAGRMLCR